MRFFLFVTVFSLCLAFAYNSSAETLEQSLRTELADANKSEASFFYRVPILSQRMFYYVPPGVASILESHKEAELMPALTALKSSADANDASLVQSWVAVAKSHMRGAQSVIDVPSGSSVKHVSVVLYSLPVFHRQP